MKLWFDESNFGARFDDSPDVAAILAAAADLVVQHGSRADGHFQCHLINQASRVTAGNECIRG